MYEIIIREITEMKRGKIGAIFYFLKKLLNLYIRMIENEIITLFKERINWKDTHRLMRKKSEMITKYKEYLPQQWLNKKIPNTYNLIEIPKNGISVIYMIYSTKTKHTYIGETQSMKKRIETELRNAYKSTKYIYKNKNNNFSHFEKVMGRIGVETWGYRILCNLGELKYNAKNCRLNMEKAYIKHLKPSLNKPSRKEWIESFRFDPILLEKQKEERVHENCNETKNKHKEANKYN